MESLKAFKSVEGGGGAPGTGSGSKSPQKNVSLSIRFNACEETLEDVLKPSSEKNSPQHNMSDEFNWRKDFLHGNFFHRKRSGSIESKEALATSSGIGSGAASCTLSTTPTTSSFLSTLTTTHNPNNSSPSASDSSPSGTWKLIKGKVSQAMEDIKSSKSHLHLVQQQQHHTSSEQQKDPSIGEVNDASIKCILNEQKDEITVSPESEPIDIFTNPQQKHEEQSSPQKTSILRKSLANLRSKTNSSTTSSPGLRKTAASTLKKTNDSSIPAEMANSDANEPQTCCSTFLRKRKKATSTSDDQAESISKAKSRYSKGSDTVEIESGVEVLEDMEIISAMTGSLLSDELMIDDESVLSGYNNSAEILNINEENMKILYKVPKSSIIEEQKQTKVCMGNPPKKLILNQIIEEEEGNKLNELYEHFVKIRLKFLTISSFIILLLLPLTDFFRGIFACLFTIFLFSTIYELIEQFIESLNGTSNDGSRLGPEKQKFSIPNYQTMEILEVPAAEEHQPLKSYAGWMNEINNYDPADYHISLTRSVFIRLDGSILRISNTSSRIKKRAMWNEPKFDKRNTIFTKTKRFNLLGCHVEMCPRGLARKRYFSRKYPIQLIIKNHHPNEGNYSDTSGNKSLIEFASKSRDVSSEDLKTIDSSMTTSMQKNHEDAASVGSLSHQSSNESGEERTFLSNDENRQTQGMDFGATILNCDLQKLQDETVFGKAVPGKNTTLTASAVPCGDETRILLFARCDREKENWYRRFLAASEGSISDKDLRIPDIVMISEEEITAAIRATTGGSSRGSVDRDTQTTDNRNSPLSTTGNLAIEEAIENAMHLTSEADNIEDNTTITEQNTNRKQSGEDKVGGLFEGLLMTNSAARNPRDYIAFMSIFQKACLNNNNKNQIPVIKKSSSTTSFPTSHDTPKRNRRQKKQEDDLWKGIDQSLYLGPSGSIVWANVLIGRVLYSCLNDSILLEKIQIFLQKKLNAIKLPNFMEDVVISEVHLGNTPPLIHRISQPLLDESGTWLDADITYEGLVQMTITTKLNLLRLKKQQQQQQQQPQSGNVGESLMGGTSNNNTTPPNHSPIATDFSPSPNIEESHALLTSGFDGSSPTITNAVHFPHCAAIYDSDAESSGASSTDSESISTGALYDLNSDSFYTPQAGSVSGGGGGGTGGVSGSSGGSSRRLLRIVDRIAASNLFQSATEISYIQRAIENMNTKITLRVELKGLVGRIILNIPPPPSDRIWIGFRGPPRLWISAKPAVGDHTFDWSIVTNVIESKLCDEVYKLLVYPNMVDIIAPFLGQSTYKE